MKKITTILLLLLGITVFGQANCDVSNPSNNFQGGRQCSADYNWTVANDIIVPADIDMTLNSIMVSIGMNNGVNATSVLVTIYNNANGIPGNSITSETITPTSQTYRGSGFGVDFSDLVLDIAPVTLPGSAGVETRYWVAVQVTTSNNTTAYIETTKATMVGLPLTFSDGGTFITPDPDKDSVYTFFADCEPKTGGGFPAPYCGPLVFGTVEPITLVEVAGISNTSSAVINNTPGHEDFVNIVGEMEQGKTYSIALEANTAGDYINTFVVFIDWNQNGVLDDAGEIYEIAQQISNSTGTDGKQAIDDIQVPANAVLGTTRMRVKKTFEGPFLGPCTPGSSWGQAEDYSIEVTEDLGITENNALSGFSLYPNPSSNVINLKTAKNIESISIYNLLGQEVFTSNLNTHATEINVSHFSNGTYILKVSIDGEIGTYRFLKQ